MTHRKKNAKKEKNAKQVSTNIAISIQGQFLERKERTKIKKKCFDRDNFKKKGF
jgi:hypothetical protein